MTALATAFGIVFLAELGDKTMLFSLTAAARYRWWMVLVPISLATALLTALAVVIGGVAGEVLPDQLVALIAAVLFIGFGIWTLKGDHDENGDDLRTGLRSPWRVMLALGGIFFLAELGDKTQIATLSLAGLYEAREAILVWAGATIGMIAANAIAIAAGSGFQRYLPERYLRLAAGVVFIAFGVVAVFIAFR